MRRPVRAPAEASMPISFSSPGERDLRARGHGVTAVLGPTNTGKTHLAIERMLAHSSGLIGLPLRLLAREVYNKITDRVGTDAVALITGEEKIKPANPRFWAPPRSVRWWKNCYQAPTSSAARVCRNLFTRARRRSRANHAVPRSWRFRPTRFTRSRS